ncbi:MAG: Ig-like domain-containing protein [Deltaproteobacteria bacterium]|nr:Ig-like domain-containing protein [Deltaproteobacteria bacterium]
MTKKVFLNSLLVFIYTVVIFLSFHTDIYAQPTVVSTVPANGATDVSPDLEMVSIHFSVSMDPSSRSITSNFPYSSWTWTENNTVLNLIKNTQTPLSKGVTYMIMLNPQGSAGYRDAQLNPLPETTIFFTVPRSENTPPPEVASTTPANGAINISKDLQTVSIRFSNPMNATSGIFSTNFPSYTKSWSENNTVLSITRNDLSTSLQGGFTYVFGLNPSGYEEYHFIDNEGNFLAYTTFSFTTEATDVTPPYVISTTPANGAINVSRDLQSISIRFSEPMNPGFGGMANSNFPEASGAWSENYTVLTRTKEDSTARLYSGGLYSFELNPSWATDPFLFRDTQGNLLPYTTFSFITPEEYDENFMLIEGNPGRGFHWQYLLYIPENLRKRTVIMVEPNNSGTVSDDMDIHRAMANTLVQRNADLTSTLNVPVLVPVFPRPEKDELLGTYTHALDENTLRATAYIDGKSIARLDLQLIAMIEDARERLESRGHTVAEKVFMMGFSASGAFTSRFTAIHPDMIMAAAPGSPGGWPIAPVTTWEGIPYRYPIGLSNFRK